MAAVVHLDTHVVVWLYAGQTERLSRAARRACETMGLVISPIVGLELAYLQEIGRLRAAPADIVADLGQRLGLMVSAVPFARVMSATIHETWTRDPFDRTIVAQARLEELPLLTKDARMRAAYKGARW